MQDTIHEGTGQYNQTSIRIVLSRQYMVITIKQVQNHAVMAVQNNGATQSICCQLVCTAALVTGCWQPQSRPLY